MQTKPDGGNSDLSERATKVMKNMSEGEFGTRGELYVGLQFLMIFLVVLGPVFEDSLIEMGFGLGLLVCVAGIAFGGAAVLQVNVCSFPGA